MTCVHIEKQRWALVLVLVLAVSAGAHIGDRVYPVAWLSEEMLEKIDLRDGLVDDWYEVVGEPSMTMLDFASLDPEGSPDPSDFDFRIWLAWHDDPPRFYVAFVSSDDVYKNTHNYDGVDFMGLNDSISLVIDGDHSGGVGCSAVFDCAGPSAEKVREHTQKYNAIALTPDGPNLDDRVTRQEKGEFSWAVLPPYGDAGGGVFGENPTISVIELFVTPFDRWAYDDIEGSVASDLNAGQVIGFGIMVTDEEDDPGIWLEASGGFDHLEAMFFLKGDGGLDGLLLPLGGGQPGEDSAVESVSWGRIKASLEM